MPSCEAGRCRTWVLGPYLPFVFAFFCMPLLHRCADRCGVCWDEELFQFKDRVELFFGVGVKTCGCIGWRSRFVSLMSPLF